ncbi:MAG: efflux RND transporter permease subunit [Sulfurospirillaceae bacterium]|nr:efflux RND transporter permease subunit [Sulfurospirillaceae bacterium]MDD2826676.1 efflux RND transporter permease subunit [Sulfurospirillaceae bacterium]
MENGSYKITDIAGRLAKLFLHNPLTSTLGVALILLGYLALTITPREEDPQIAISGGTIIVMLPGASADEIEKVIVKPLERRIKEIKGVENIYGIAADNVGIVNVMYYIGENRESSNLKLYDKVMQNMDQMPSGAMQPLVRPFDIDIDIPIMSVAFYQKPNSHISNVDLYEKVDALRNELIQIKNVAKTEIKGEHKEQYNIEVDLGKLSGFHLSMGQIVMGLKSLSVSVPSINNRTSDGKLVVFGIKNAIDTVEDIQNLMIAQYMGSPIYLKDIAKVTKSYDIQNLKKAEISYRENEKMTPMHEQVTLTLAKLKGSNAVVIAENVLEKLEEHRATLDKEGIGYIITRNYGERANEAVNELVFHLLISIVIIAILLVFVLGWRESLIVTFTVPAILAITVFVAYMTGQTINRITLFAFLLSLGLLVDAAIIVIENIHRHLHDHSSRDKDIDHILIEATDEIGAPTNIATIAIILTMVPMAFVGQMMGEFMKPIPLNVPVALLSSLLIAYIFTPYLARKLLKKPMHHEGENK